MVSWARKNHASWWAQHKESQPPKAISSPVFQQKDSKKVIVRNLGV
ncbi:hypothetical protein NC651_032398 [Populus alba x Populus x berolinensis]|nr:hypothetical protein NC651_032398 [Populus alba x Populus x berolinensis]